MGVIAQLFPILHADQQLQLSESATIKSNQHQSTVYKKNQCENLKE